MVTKGVGEMTPKKPDRWERMVLKVTYPDMCVDKDAAINLLRKEHAEMVNIVQNHLSKWTDRTGPDIDAQEAYGRRCRALQCQEILDQLKRRAK